MQQRKFFVQNLNSGSLFDNFLISSVASILVIRFYLHLAHYPQIGGNGLHIAHMLWGGFFMLTALVLLFSFLTNRVKSIAAVIGGIGFGTFIDELGKFITNDNNYFFQPTIALIYVIFILLYLVSRYLQREQNYSKETYVINAMEAIKEVVLHDLDHKEEALAKMYLGFCDQKEQFIKSLAKMLEEAEVLSQKKPNIAQRVFIKTHEKYLQLIKTSKMQTVIIIGFLLVGFVAIAQALVVTEFIRQVFINGTYPKISDLSFAETGDLIFSTISGLFIIAGAIVIRRSRLKAYQLFRTAILISLFLTQFFIFYDVQFEALIGFTINILLFVTLQNMILWEKEKQPTAS